MRIRSYTKDREAECQLPVGRSRCARGRSSKVQNNALRVCVGPDLMDVYFELQALLHKDANIVAHALRAVVDYVIKVALPGFRVTGNCVWWI